MKNLKTFLFLGLITLFSSTAFAQDPHPTKFQVDTYHSFAKERNNNGSTVKGTPNIHETTKYSRTDDDNSPHRLRDDWMDYYREAIFFGIF